MAIQMGEKIPDNYPTEPIEEPTNNTDTSTEVDTGGNTPSLPPLLVEHYKIDMDTGAIIDNIVIDLNHEEVPEDCKAGWGGRGFFDPVYSFDLNDWVENKPEAEILDFYRGLKDKELNRACQESILDGFEHTIDGLTYKFSYDMQAQSNFGDSRQLLNDGVIMEIPWTAKLDGNYVRINITKDIMNDITLTIMNHKAGNISKYRDILLPKVMEATSVEEIQAVDWEDV